MRRKTKWTLGILLSLVLLVGLMLGTSATAWADGNVARIGDTEYETLQAAIDACPKDGTATTITMIADYTGDDITNPADQTGTGIVVTGQNITLDLAGHKIQTKLTTNGDTYHLAHVLYVNGGTLTLKDSSQDQTGAIVNTNSESYFCTRVVLVTNSATFTMESGRITATSGEGMSIKNATVNLNGGVVEATTGSDGNSYGWSNAVAGIEVRGNSTVTIDGATVISKGENAIWSDTASDKITIKSGVLSGNKGYGAIGGAQAQKTITITGGYFNTDPTSFLDVTAYKAVVQDSGSPYDKYYKVEPVVAEPVTVTTLADLLAATQSATLTEPKDITLGANIVVDTQITLGMTSKLNIPSAYTLSVVSGGLFQNDGRTTNQGEISVSGGGFFSNLLAVEGEGKFSGYPDTTGTYQITYPMDLEWMSWLNREVYNVTDAVLTTDITMPDVYFDPIPGFYGTFDGNGHSISNLKLHSTSQPLGLFNTLGISLNDEHTFVQDLTIEEELSTVSARCGGLAAYTTGNVHITGVKMQGSMEASGATYYFAPFVGWAHNDGHHLYIADSETSMTVTADHGANIGPIIGSAGNGQSFTIGIYNFKNTGAISAKGADYSIGYVLGYGYGKSTTEPITIDVINYENTGSITNNHGTWKDLGTGANYLCCNSDSRTTFKTTYISTANTAYYNQFKDIYSTDTPPVALIERTGEETQYFDSLKDAVDAAQSGDTITMAQNVNLGTDATTTLLSIPETANLTLDLNGFVISGSTTVVGARIINNNGTLVIRDSSASKTGEIKNISTTKNDCIRTLGNGTDSNHTASMTIESGKISSTVGQVIINQANLKIEKDVVLETTAAYTGSFSNGAVVLDNRAPGVVEIDGATLTSNDGMLMFIYPSSGSNVSIKGGTFTAKETRGLIGGSGAGDVKITGGTFNIDPSAMVVQGYYVEETGSLYTVKKMDETIVTVTSEAELSQALSMASATKSVKITISGDVSVKGNLKLAKGSSITIPQGNTLRVADGGVLMLEGAVENQGTLTIAKDGFLGNPLPVKGDGDFTYEGYDETASTYSISSPMGLQWLAVVNNGETIDDLEVEVTQDIVFPNGVVFQQIPYFCGTFDGMNHTISGLVINAVSSYTGVFTGMSYATIKNVTLDATITANNGTIGGMAGYVGADTHFQNVKTAGSITVGGSGYGASGFVGAVAGTDANSRITFENCESSMTISAPNASIVGGFYGTASSNTTPIDVMDCTYSGNMTSGGYCATVGGFMSYEQTGKTTVYGHSIKGTVTGGDGDYQKGKKINDVMVLGADGYGEIKGQGVASVGDTSYSNISEAVDAALAQKKPLSLNTNMDTAVNIELTNDDDVFMLQQNGFTEKFNVTYGGTDGSKTIRTRVDTNITVKYVGPIDAAEGDTEFEKDDPNSGISGLGATDKVEEKLRKLAEADDTSTDPGQVKDVTVTLEAKAVENSDTDEQNAIAIAVTDKVSEASTTDFLELTVIKRVTVLNADGTKDTDKSTETKETNLNQVLDISVKYDMAGKHNLMISRYHNGAVTFFTKLNEVPTTPVDGTFYVEGTGADTIIHLYTSKFSTYGFTTFGTSEYPVINGYALELGGVLGLRYYMLVPEGFDGNGAAMTFTMNNRENQVIPYSEIKTDTQGIYFTCNVYSYQMADTITATFTYKMEGTTKTLTDTYSVKQYLDSLAEGTYTGGAQKLVNATRAYGHFIQPYLARVHGWTVGGKYAALDYSGTVDVSAAKTGSAANKFTLTTMNSAYVQAAQYRLLLNADTSLIVEVRLKNTPAGSVSMTDNGNAVTPTVSGTAYRVEIGNIAANNLWRTHRVVMKIGSTTVFDFTASPLSYVYTVLSKSSPAADEQNALAALYEYWHAAYAYNHT